MRLIQRLRQFFKRDYAYVVQEYIVDDWFDVTYPIRSLAVAIASKIRIDYVESRFPHRLVIRKNNDPSTDEVIVINET